MRSLAAIRVQQAREVIDGVRAYTDAIDAALANALLLVAEAPPRREDARSACLAIAFCAEHGFVGAFNDRILAEAVEVTQSAGDAIAVVGSRGRALAEGLGRRIVWDGAQAAKADSLTEVARRTTDALYRILADGAFHRVVLVFAQSAGATWEVVTRPILPFDVAPFRDGNTPPSPPLHTLSPADLLESLIDEFVFGEIVHASAESFAAEHAARLVAMDGAHRNVERMLADLVHAANRSRQEEITEEMMDVVTGAKALLAT